MACKLRLSRSFPLGEDGFFFGLFLTQKFTKILDFIPLLATPNQKREVYFLELIYVTRAWDATFITGKNL